MKINKNPTGQNYLAVGLTLSKISILPQLVLVGKSIKLPMKINKNPTGQNYLAVGLTLIYLYIV